MNIVKLVNATDMRLHVSCMNKMLMPRESFSISESELERTHELLTCISKEILRMEEDLPPDQEKPKVDAEEVEQPEDESVSSADEVVDESQQSTEEDSEDTPVDIEEELGVRISDADKTGNPDGKAYVKFDDNVVKVDPMTSQIGKDEPSEGDEQSEDGKRYIDGIEVLDTTKGEKTLDVDGIDVVVNEDDGKDEYGPQFIEAE